jgi:DNA-binding response OmpR family regulator
MYRKDNKIQVLYVEDDATIAFLTRDNLELRGFEVSHTSDGEEALRLFKQRHFDICVIDIMLPSMDGFSLAKEIRIVDRMVPVLFLSAKSMVEDRIHGLLLGADDYITKPFSMEELILRMEVFLRRNETPAQRNRKVIMLAESKFDMANQLVELKGEQINLTRRECELLEYLVEHKNQIVKQETILKAVWGDDDYFLGRSLDVFISRLRKVFAGDQCIRIQNVHGVGFRFIVEELPGTL